MPSEQKQPIRVTISQAANLFGISEKTIRRAIKDQEVLYIVVRGVYKINFESLLKWSQSRVKTLNKFNRDGIGQYVDKWKIKNKLYSPNPKTISSQEKNDHANKPSNNKPPRPTSSPTAPQ
ncbi:MAG TPA: helix-turn-helix domain-containing protein [bacterium]|nr:helix-turn-helix domain-containing protein [bacterium]HNS33654.1 helix-turn-helix domain-containing protein [bacterium]HNZ73772.1 helix-turn-helix domain-containing protein [bacterium]HOH67108.1 helix-turn-helix domain-containing protein [bacterium]